MIREAYGAYQEFALGVLPANVQVFKVGALEQIAQYVQERLGTPDETSAARLALPQLNEADTLSTYECQLYVVSPTPDALVTLLDTLLAQLTRNQGLIHNRFRPRTRNLEGLAYTAALLTFQIMI